MLEINQIESEFYFNSSISKMVTWVTRKKMKYYTTLLSKNEKLSFCNLSSLQTIAVNFGSHWVLYTCSLVSGKANVTKSLYCFAPVKIAPYKWSIHIWLIFMEVDITTTEVIW